MAQDYETLRYEVRDGIGFITLDRPPLNLIDMVLTHEYFDVLAAADADKAVKVLVLSGAGRGLSAGVDIRVMREFDSVQMDEFVQLFYVEQVRRVRALTKPIIAAVHGFAREGACTMAFSCDMVVASEDATFGYPGVPNLAAPPGMHVWHLQRLLGRMKAAWLILSGEPMTAIEADRGGLLTAVVPTGSLMESVTAMALKLSALSPRALRDTRALMYRMECMDFDEVPEAAAAAISSAFDTPDSREARLAFLEKRPPRWEDA
jgi:enoyl-CoA hydratase/carnithine racemase